MRYDMRFSPRGRGGEQGPARYGREYGYGFRRGYEVRGGFARGGPPPPPPREGRGAYGASRWRRPPWRRGGYDAPLHGWLPGWWDDVARRGGR